MIFSAHRPAIAIASGAIAGALSRYYLGSAIAQLFPSSFPYATFAINLTGCGAMGFFVTLFAANAGRFPRELNLFLLTGFLGSYTTFSSYEFESTLLLQQQQWLAFGLYWAGSLVLGWGALELGIILARIGDRS